MSTPTRLHPLATAKKRKRTCFDDGLGCDGAQGVGPVTPPKSPSSLPRAPGCPVRPRVRDGRGREDSASPLRGSSGDVVEGVARCIRMRLRGLGDGYDGSDGLLDEGGAGCSGSAFLDPWERARIVELADLVRAVPPDSGSQKRVGRARSGVRCFSFGTGEGGMDGPGLGGGTEALVVVEARELFDSSAATVWDEMERRARSYLQKACSEDAFRQGTKTVVLVWYGRGADGRREVFTTISRRNVRCAKRAFVTSIAASGRVELVLSDFLPWDVIELGFGADESGIRGCDRVEIGVDVGEIVGGTVK